VELFANGVSLGKQTSDVHFFYFDVPNVGETELVAKAGDCEDSSKIVKVAEFNNDYRMVETGDVLNWFDITEVEGHFSINDKAGDVLKTMQGKLLFMGLMKKALSGSKGMVDASTFEASADMMGFLGGFTVKRLLSMMGTMGAKPLTKEEMLEFNKKLNKIKKK
jgi:beta-galactosidase